MAEPTKPSRLQTLATVLTVVAALYLARDVLIPVALAGLLSFALAPLVVRLQRWIGRVASVVLVVTLACGTVGGIGYLVGGQLAELAHMLPQYRENITAKIGSLRVGVVEKTTKAMKEIEQEVQQQRAEKEQREKQEQQQQQQQQSAADPQDEPADAMPVSPDEPVAAAPQTPTKVEVVEPEPSPLELLARAAGPLIGPLGTAGMVIVLLVFMLLSREDLRDRIVRLMGRGRIRLTTQAMDDAAAHVSRYLSAQAILNGIHGVTVALGMFVLGVPGFLLWGLLSAALRFVPYVGPWIAAAMPVLVAIAVFDGWSFTLLVVGFFVLLELVSNNVLEPWLYGSSAGVSPLAIIVSAIFWTWLWGPLGLLLATPMTVCLVVMGKYMPRLQFIHILLGNEPVLEPHARFYQRLVAMNHDEASEVAEAFLDESGSLVATYDEVCLPALAMAEHDRHAGDLDETRSRYLHNALREIVAELGELAASNRAAATQAPRDEDAAKPKPKPKPKATAKGDEGTDTKTPPPPLPELPADLDVVALPAHDEADEIACLMLAELVRASGARATAAALGERRDHVLATNENGRVVVISAVPPSAISHARHVHKRLRSHRPDAAVVIGLWTTGGRLDQVAPHLPPGTPTSIVANLRDAFGELARVGRELASAAR